MAAGRSVRAGVDVERGGNTARPALQQQAPWMTPRRCEAVAGRGSNKSTARITRGPDSLAAAACIGRCAMLPNVWPRSERRPQTRRGAAGRRRRSGGTLAAACRTRLRSLRAAGESGVSCEPTHAAVVQRGQTNEEAENELGTVQKRRDGMVLQHKGLRWMGKLHQVQHRRVRWQQHRWTGKHKLEPSNGDLSNNCCNCRFFLDHEQLLAWCCVRLGVADGRC